VQPKTLARKIAGFALVKKARNIIIMDLRKLTDVTDYFVVCSADSDTQVKAIADAVMDGTERLGVPVWQREGISQRQWILLDYVDVVVHVFHKEVRKYYNLEKLWGDSVIEPVSDGDARPRKSDRPPVRRRVRKSA
jgi:ribosome-associated protein